MSTLEESLFAISSGTSCRVQLWPPCLSVAFTRLLVAQMPMVPVRHVSPAKLHDALPLHQYPPIGVRVTSSSRHRFVSYRYTANDHLEAAIVCTSSRLHKRPSTGSGDRPNAAAASGSRGCVDPVPHYTNQLQDYSVDESALIGIRCSSRQPGGLALP